MIRLLINKYTLLFYTTFLIILLTIAWGTNKGFDFTDEGFYLLNYAKDQESGLTNSYITLVLKPLGFSILELRITRVILSVASAAVLWFGIHRLLRTDKHTTQHDMIFLALLLISSFLSYTFCPQTISYNTLASNVSFIIIGLTLLVLSNSLATWTNFAILFLIGLITYICFLSKSTTGIIIILIVISLITATYFRDKNRCIQYITFFLSGLLCSEELVRITTGSSAFSVLENLSQISIELRKITDGYSLGTLIYRQFIILADSVKFTLFLLVAYLPFFFWQFRKTALNFAVTTLYHLAVFAGLIWLFSSERSDYTLNAKNIRYVLVDLAPGLIPYCLIIVAYFYVIYRSIKIETRNIMVSATLIITCFAIILGTNNYFLFNIVFTLPLLISALYILNIPEEVISNTFLKSLSTVFLFVAVTSIFYYYIIRPYRTFPLWQQKQEIALQPLKGLKLDSKTIEYINRTSTILNKSGFRKGDYVIGIYRLPGLIFAINGISPGSILWAEESRTMFLKSLDITTLNKDKKIFFLVNDMGSDEFYSALEERGINFKEYHEVGKVYNQYYNKYTYIYSK